MNVVGLYLSTDTVLKWALYEGETQECCWIKLYFVAAKQYIPVKANSRVAYENNRLI